MLSNFFKYLDLLIISIICIFLSSGSLFADPPTFNTPIDLTSDGETIPDDGSGYTASNLGDLDDDGDFDLLVGTFVGGSIYLYENTGEREDPVYAHRGMLETDGEEIHSN